MNQTDVTIECNLDEYIRNRGLKKAWIADQLGVSNQVVSGWVKGSPPSLVNSVLLAGILECKVEDIWIIKIKNT